MSCQNDKERCVTTDNDAITERRIEILGRLWTTAGKRISSTRMAFYLKALGDIPLDLLEIAVERAIAGDDYCMVVVPAVVMCEVERELRWPDDLPAALKKWEDERAREGNKPSI
jgi:hypothetical protein